MQSQENKGRAQAIQAYLEGIGHPISTVQAHEVLARALGFKNKHVLAQQGDTLPELEGFGTRKNFSKEWKDLATTAVLGDIANPTNADLAPQVVAPEALQTMAIGGTQFEVFPLDRAPFTIAEMQQRDFTFNVVIGVPLDELEDGERSTEYVSKAICGEENALESVRFKHVPGINYGQDVIAYAISGYISAPEDFFPELEAAANSRFYASLASLFSKLKAGAELTAQVEGSASQEMTVVSVSLDNLERLRQYAETEGGNNEDINRHCREILLAFKGPGVEHTWQVDVNHGRYASIVDGHSQTWVVFAKDGVNIRLTFK